MSLHQGNVCMLVLCGLPGAGKSTLVNKLLAQQQQQNFSGIIRAGDGGAMNCLFDSVCFDDLLHNMTNSATTSKSSVDSFLPEVWKKAQQMMTRRVQERIFSMPTDRQSILLVDDNFHLSSLRKRMYHIAQQAGCGFGILHVNTPLVTCRTRNAMRNGAAHVPDEVFERMVERFEPPDCSRSHELNTVCFTGVEPIEMMIMTLLMGSRAIRERWEAARQQVQTLNQQQTLDHQATAMNIVHTLDLSLRRQISGVMRKFNGSKVDKGAFAQHLNHVRKQLLHSFHLRLSQRNKIHDPSLIEELTASFATRCTTGLETWTMRYNN